MPSFLSFQQIEFIMKTRFKRDLVKSACIHIVTTMRTASYRTHRLDRSIWLKLQWRARTKPQIVKGLHTIGLRYIRTIYYTINAFSNVLRLLEVSKERRCENVSVYAQLPLLVFQDRFIKRYKNEQKFRNSRILISFDTNLRRFAMKWGGTFFSTQWYWSNRFCGRVKAILMTKRIYFKSAYFQYRLIVQWDDLLPRPAWVRLP